MVIDKRTFFTLRLSKNIAAIENEKERMEACKILLSYTKAHEAESYEVHIGETSIHAYAYPSRDNAKKYLISNTANIFSHTD